MKYIGTSLTKLLLYQLREKENTVFSLNSELISENDKDL